MIFFDHYYFLGVVTSMFAIGPIFGFGLAAVASQLPEDLGGMQPLLTYYQDCHISVLLVLVVLLLSHYF